MNRFQQYGVYVTPFLQVLLWLHNSFECQLNYYHTTTIIYIITVVSYIHIYIYHAEISITIHVYYFRRYGVGLVLRAPRWELK